MSRIAFLFPGQGAQTVGMGKRLAESLPGARRLYDRAADVLGYDLAKLCFEGPAEDLDSTVYSQPAMFVTSLAALGVAAGRIARRGPVLRGRGRAEPGRIHGHGVCRGDGVRGRPDAGAAARRGHARGRRRHAQRHGEHPRAGAGRRSRPSARRPAAARSSKIANLLCPGNIVISGTIGGLRAGGRDGPVVRGDEGRAAGRGRRVSYRDHAAGRRASAPRPWPTCPCSKPRIPVISNVDALPHDDPEEIRQLLVRQILQPVRWEDSMRYLIAPGFRPVLRSRPRPRASRAAAADRPQGVVPVRGSVSGRRLAISSCSSRPDSTLTTENREAQS